MTTANAPGRLADQLYEEILAWIVRGAVRPGEKLPSETALGQQFNVSRPVVREALSRLQADGVVNCRRGSGSYVQHRPKREFFDLAPIGGIADLMRCFEYRVAVEAAAAALAATRRTAQDLQAIGEALQGMADAIEHGRVGTEADIQFHQAIAAATKNRLFESTLASLADYTLAGINVARNLSLRANKQQLLRVQQEHQRIFDAIVAQDADAARDAMQTHLSNARIRILSDSVEPREE